MTDRSKIIPVHDVVAVPNGVRASGYDQIVVISQGNVLLVHLILDPLRSIFALILQLPLCLQLRLELGDLLLSLSELDLRVSCINFLKLLLVVIRLDLCLRPSTLATGLEHMSGATVHCCNEM